MVVCRLSGVWWRGQTVADEWYRREGAECISRLTRGMRASET